MFTLSFGYGIISGLISFSLTYFIIIYSSFMIHGVRRNEPILSVYLWTVFVSEDTAWGRVVVKARRY